MSDTTRLLYEIAGMLPTGPAWAAICDAAARVGPGRATLLAPSLQDAKLRAIVGGDADGAAALALALEVLS